MNRYSKLFIDWMILGLTLLFMPLWAADGEGDWDNNDQPFTRILDLRGQWYFELGDNKDWAQAEHEDSDWDVIFVPARWEDEGFPGYDGFAWYRRHFKISRDIQSSTIYLLLGQIDDVDAVYINGHLVGYSGDFPPNYWTAWHRHREYVVPASALNFDGDNVIAIRVFDEGGAGGIVGNKIGFFRKENDPIFEKSLAGTWKFKTGDKGAFRKPSYNDEDWRDIMVPALWESQGIHDYDGIGWYRKRFRLPENLDTDGLVLLLGKIDDFDEVFLNGKHIGTTGRMGKRVGPDRLDDTYRKLRIYYLPDDLINKGGENILAVRVYDGWQHGGIYEGPIGIITEKNLRSWIRATNQTSLLTRFLQIFFE